MLRNLSSLSPEDQEAFVELLKSGAPRFVVHRLSTAYPLLSKGILRSVQILDDLDWMRIPPRNYQPSKTPPTHRG